MTLTVQDLVTKFDDFADDAIVRTKQNCYNGEIEVGTIIRNIAYIQKDSDRNVFLISELFSNKTVTLTVQDLVTKFDDFADDAIVRVKRFFPLEGTYTICKVVDIERDEHDSVVLLTEFVSIKNHGHEESEKKSEDQDFDFEKE